nr:uncharacterized protein LOC117222144 isoform X2 [Megalopta genalis]
MSKWNEKLIMKFLKIYKQHPCLWNPYDKRYYNCKEKNEALQRIIDDLCIPGFTITDYLQQIKLIREKYKKEQLRTIKGLQLHKQYKSPIPWYNIVANMLMKVISDEERMNSVPAKTVPPDTSVLKSLSSDNIRHTDRKEDKTRIQPCTNVTCDIVARRSRSARSSIKYIPSKTTAVRSSTRTKYVLCPQARIASKTRNGDGLSNRKPKRAFNWKVPDCPRTPSNSINSTATNSTKTSIKQYEPPFLKCPLCGWENLQQERTQEQRTIIPCANYSIESPDLKYAPCSGCIKDGFYPETYTDDSGDFIKDLSKSAPAKVSTLDTETQTTESLQTQVMQLDPTVKTTFGSGAIEACTRFKIILPDSKKSLEMHTVGTENVCQCTQGVQCLQPQLCTKGTQLSLELKKNAHTSTVTYKERGTQCTVCMPEEGRCSASIQTIRQSSVQTMTRSSSLEKMKDVGTTSSIHRIHSSDSVTLVSYKSVGTGGEYALPSRAKSHGSLKRCIQQKDYKEVAVGETELYIKPCNADTCPRNMSELMKDPTVTTVLHQLLCKISSKTNRVSRCIKSQTDYEQRKYSTGCATDATEMVKRIKEYAITALGVHLSKDECIQTSTDTETTPSVCVNKLTMTREDPYKPINRSTGVQVDGNNRTSGFKEIKKRVADKEVCTCCEYKDIGTNGSLLRTCDMGIQNGLDNSVCSNKIETDKHLRSTVGTQKRDPILVRVIKCTDAQTIKKTDKETLTDKRIEACGRSTCAPYTVCVPSYKEESKHQVNRDYHERSCMSRCDDTCKGNSNKDWTDVTNVDAFNCIRNSKIPLCTYPVRKCTFARSN